MSENMAGKVAIVTGGSRGIGRAIAETLAANGATVVVSSRNAPDDPFSPDSRITHIAADAAEPEQTTALVATTMERFGRIDILVNNAGSVAHFGPVLSASLEEWDAAFLVNLRGVFFLTQAVVGAWMGEHGGSIVNIASIAGMHGHIPNVGIYGVSKAALIMLTKQLAHELGPQKIRVNAIAPGLIKTEFSRPLWEDPSTLAFMLIHNPMQRPGLTSEAAEAAVFFCSDAASYVSGQILTVDGGTRS